MSVSKFNAEGYHDPTVYEALTNIEKEEKQRKRRSYSSAVPLPVTSKETPEGQEDMEDLQ